jgi:peptidoglycan/LPS O-acetylase OafA/YrhL
MDGELTCGQLVASWLLMVLGFALISRYEHLGFLMAFLLLIGAQRIRDDHDREIIERCRNNPVWKAFAAIYYFGLLAVAVEAVWHHHDLANDSIGILMVLFFFPFLIAMLAADYAVCSKRHRQPARSHEHN